MITLRLPIRTQSEMNMREHWAKKASRARSHRCVAKMVGNATTLPNSLTFPLVVTLTRVAPRPLDDDNVRGALKATRDGIADWLQVDDRKSDIVRYEYAQQKGKRGEYAVLVSIESKEARQAG